MLRASWHCVYNTFSKTVLNLLYFLGINVLDSFIEYLEQCVAYDARMDKSKINNRVEYLETYTIAQNWLAELYGILCNNVYSDSDENCSELSKQISDLRNDEKIRANIITSDNQQLSDIHLEFLLFKHLCNVSKHTYIY